VRADEAVQESRGDNAPKAWHNTYTGGRPIGKMSEGGAGLHLSSGKHEVRARLGRLLRAWQAAGPTCTQVLQGNCIQLYGNCPRRSLMPSHAIWPSSSAMRPYSPLAAPLQPSSQKPHTLG